MSAGNQRKSAMLGMSFGTACNRLRKSILFDLVCKMGQNVCFQCGERIEDIEKFSIEHKKPWMHEENAVELFFDLDNIAYSHLGCNSKTQRQFRKLIPCPSHQAYDRGCRCDGCVQAFRKLKREEARRRRNTKAENFRK